MINKHLQSVTELDRKQYESIC